MYSNYLQSIRSWNFGLAGQPVGGSEGLSPIGARIQVTGNSGSGKMTLAGRLAKALDAKFVDLDALNCEPAG